MMKIDGTVTISLKDYEMMKRRIEEYENLLNLAIRTDSQNNWIKEYEIDIEELVRTVMKRKLRISEIPSIEIPSEKAYVTVKSNV